MTTEISEQDFGILSCVVANGMQHRLFQNIFRHFELVHSVSVLD